MRPTTCKTYELHLDGTRPVLSQTFYLPRRVSNTQRVDDGRPQHALLTPGVAPSNWTSPTHTHADIARDPEPQSTRKAELTRSHAFDGFGSPPQCRWIVRRTKVGGS